MTRRRGLVPKAMQRNLQDIVNRTRAVHPGTKLVVAGMRAAPNLGQSYRVEFEAVFPRVAKHYDGVLIPFILEDVAGEPHQQLLFAGIASKSEVVHCKVIVDEELHRLGVLRRQAEKRGRLGGDPAAHFAMVLLVSLAQVVHQQGQVQEVLSGDTPVDAAQGSHVVQ